MLDIGDTLPERTITLDDDRQVGFDTFTGQWLVLYFYPKDSTPGCTDESRQFRDLHDAFRAASAAIVGVSRDSTRSHRNFRSKQELPFPLISDTDETLCSDFGVIKEKNMYGRKVLGIERSTFLFDPAGVLRHAWRGVKVAGHAAAVLETLDRLKRTP